MVMEEVKFGFENLELWKKAREFKNEVSKEARKEHPKKNSSLQIRSSEVQDQLMPYYQKGTEDSLSLINFIFVFKHEAHFQKQ